MKHGKEYEQNKLDAPFDCNAWSGCIWNNKKADLY
jgi:hypothetical protein